jgi:hypothetical protein
LSETIFTDATTPAVAPPVVAETVPPEVAELVGEGKKYKTAADALKALPHAQSHILKIEEDNANLRRELEKAKAMEELLDEFKKQGTQQYGSPTPPAQTAPTADLTDVDSVVEAILARKELERQAKQNAQVVMDAFQREFGAEAEARFVKLSQEIGMPVEQLNSLAVTSPEAVFKLAGIKKPASVGKPTSTVNTEGNFSQPQGELSARVPKGASTKDLVNAWKVAGEKVKQRNA